MSAIIRITVVAILFGGMSLLGYLWVRHGYEARVIRELQELTQELEDRLAARQAMINRLSNSRRVAHVQITAQTKDSTGRVIVTSLQFIELDSDGTELARQSFTVPGDVLFVDAWTVKFGHEPVAQGHPLMGRTLVLLRRIYSEQMSPIEGYPIDTPGAIPPAYATGEFGHFEQRLWESFWAIATDAVKAQEMGVRVAQGEAVYKPVRAGQTYELIADAAGGISLRPLSEDELSASGADG